MNLSVEHLIASEWQRWCGKPPELIRPLEGGLTNRSFLIDADDEKLVLRINAPNSRALDLNRIAEAEALQHASSNGLCVPLVYVDPDHRYLLTRFVDGAPLELNQPGALALVGKFLRELHQLTPISVTLDYAEKANRYWQSIPQEADSFSLLLKLHKSMLPLLRQASAGPGGTLCHNDLLPANLLVDKSGELRAIDWEYAACGDPYFDLATIVQGNKLDRQQQQSLLTEYLQQPAGKYELQKLDQWQKIYRYLCVLWYAVQNQHRATLEETSVLNTEIADLLATFD